jgi:glycyl-tRNA synthetase
VAVRNGDREHLENVVHGNEHVLRARFSDAAFFYKEDTQKPLDEFLPRLATLTFQEKLGSMLDKNERIAKLVDSVGKLLRIDSTSASVAQRAAHIVKADLATQMVIEMTSLQGTMGREYALLSGHTPDVADAIFEHWLPRNANDILPASPAGTLLSLIDRLDSLVGLFAVGLAPKSTADPYGLRRAALGIVQILTAKEIDLDLAKAVDLVAAAQPVEVTSQERAQVLEFITGRLRSWLEEQDWPRDVIAAILDAQSANPYRALEGIRQLTQWIRREDWTPLLDGFARCVRITRSEKTTYEVNQNSLMEPAEKNLYAAYQKAAAKLKDDGNVDAFLNAFAPMLPAVTEFFDNVLVNVEDTAVRQNRIGLLQAIGALQNGRVDMSQLSGF